MKRGKKLTRSMKAAKGGKGKGKSLYLRKKNFLASVKMWGFEFGLGEKPWK